MNGVGAHCLQDDERQDPLARLSMSMFNWVNNGVKKIAKECIERHEWNFENEDHCKSIVHVIDEVKCDEDLTRTKQNQVKGRVIANLAVREKFPGAFLNVAVRVSQRHGWFWEYLQEAAEKSAFPLNLPELTQEELCDITPEVLRKYGLEASTSQHPHNDSGSDSVQNVAGNDFMANNTRPQKRTQSTAEPMPPAGQLNTSHAGQAEEPANTSPPRKRIRRIARAAPPTGQINTSHAGGQEEATAEAALPHAGQNRVVSYPFPAPQKQTIPPSTLSGQLRPAGPLATPRPTTSQHVTRGEPLTTQVQPLNPSTPSAAAQHAMSPLAYTASPKTSQTASVGVQPLNPSTPNAAAQHTVPSFTYRASPKTSQTASAGVISPACLPAALSAGGLASPSRGEVQAPNLGLSHHQRQNVDSPRPQEEIRDTDSPPLQRNVSHIATAAPEVSTRQGASVKPQDLAKLVDDAYATRRLKQIGFPQQYDVIGIEDAVREVLRTRDALIRRVVGLKDVIRSRGDEITKKDELIREAKEDQQRMVQSLRSEITKKDELIQSLRSEITKKDELVRAAEEDQRVIRVLRREIMRQDGPEQQ